MKWKIPEKQTVPLRKGEPSFRLRFTTSGVGGTGRRTEGKRGGRIEARLLINLTL